MSAMPSEARRRHAEAYARLREREGRGASGADEVLRLPYLDEGPLAWQWRIRRRTYETFLERVVEREERRAGRPLRVLDLGAGNAWLALRLAGRGHRALAVDLRLDTVDGLGAAAGAARTQPRLSRTGGSFEALPVRAARFDLAVFNASLHDAEELGAALAEARRAVRAGGAIAILDSPFYRRDEDGRAMLEERISSTIARFGDLAADLLAVPVVGYLTRERLADAARPLGLLFRRVRVRYPIGYESRALVALLKRRRAPSRFDLWVARVPA